VVITFGLACVALAIFANDNDAKTSLFDIWEYHFPRVYAIVSFFGVLLLLICTPLGFARIFTVVGQLLVKVGSKRRRRLLLT
jgi:lauroyl/myristoyl acyltransferase